MAKKDFKSNPVMNFISQETIDKVDGKPATISTGTKKAPAGYKPNPEFIETKSRRVQILIQPSVHADAKALSEELGVSLNDFIGRALQEATRNEYVRDIITKSIKGEE